VKRIVAKELRDPIPTVCAENFTDPSGRNPERATKHFPISISVVKLTLKEVLERQ